MTLKDTMDRMRRRLETLYPANEARWMVREIFFRLKGYRLADLMLKSSEEVSDYIAGKTDAIVGRLLAHEPLQYIFGTARFYGMDMKVTPATLIPRPETEEMVDLIVKQYGGRSDLRVLDVCTGSGCIAIALARNLPFSRVEATDISEAALEVARENARTLHASISFNLLDALKMTAPSLPVFDIIVSNPPYVMESERASMDENVTGFEPPQALFVPDDDPLRFYRAIAAYAGGALKGGGRLYFEINPLQVRGLLSLGSGPDWADCEIVRDISGRDRFMILTRAD